MNLFALFRSIGPKDKPSPRGANLEKQRRLRKEAAVFGDWYIHERMLADVPRVTAYAQAIKRHVKLGDIVLDVGTGSGVLAMLAAKAGAGQVFALEMSKIVDTAKHLARANGVLSKIKFIKSHSRD